MYANHLALSSRFKPLWTERTVGGVALLISADPLALWSWKAGAFSAPALCQRRGVGHVWASADAAFAAIRDERRLWRPCVV